MKVTYTKTVQLQKCFAELTATDYVNLDEAANLTIFEEENKCSDIAKLVFEKFPEVTKINFFQPEECGEIYER